MKRRQFLGLLPGVPLSVKGLCSPPQLDFSGTWKQSNEQCVPKRTGDVKRHIDHRGSDLVVETTIVRGSGPPRHALQRYTTDGSATVSTGADGDEFHTSVVWKDNSLLFSIEEHEDGRILLSRETWTLAAEGAALKVEREDLDSAGNGTRKQTLLFLRQPSTTAAR